MPHGLVVLFEHEGEDRIGLVTGYKDGKYVVFSERDRTVELTASRLTSYQLQGPAAQASTAERSQYLANLREQFHKKADSIQLGELWEIIASEPREYTDRELAEVGFGDTSPLSLLAMRYLLLNERTFFKRSKVGFFPRSEADIIQIRRSEEALARKRAERQQVVDLFRQRISGTLIPVEGSMTGHIEELQEVALQGDNSSQSARRDVTELLGLIKSELKIDLRGDLSEQAHALLVRSRIWARRQSLSLLRHAIPISFPATVFEEVNNLPRHPEGANHYHDYRHLETVTIDDPKTLDIDDGLSLELIDNGYRIGIHVTDVASFVTPGSVLDSIGAKRATSLYCADTSVHMLPPELSEQRLSLLPGEDRYALSLFVTTDRHGRITSWNFSPTIIASKRRLSYDEVDTLLEAGDPTFLAFYATTSAHEAERIAESGVKISKREALVELNEDESLSLQIIDDSSPSRSLVAEMMIIYNRFAATLCADRGFALPFRGQDGPDSEPEPSIPEGPALDHALRIRLKRSFVGTKPSCHFTLGLGCYTQATSPLRRYLDLCAQRQLFAIATTGEPLYSAADVEELIGITEPPLSRANAASREARRFWFLAYLEDRRRTHDIIEGTIVRLEEGRPCGVELDEIFQSFPVKGIRAPRLGQVITLRIAKVDPFGDYVRLDPVS